MLTPVAISARTPEALRPSPLRQQPPNLDQLDLSIILQQHRSPQLISIAHRLEDYAHTARALSLLSQHFPRSLQLYETLPYPIWWEILLHLYKLAEEVDWFKVNWDDLKARLDIWSQNKAEKGDLLAIYLKYIPIRLYGVLPVFIHRYPPLELLYVLLQPREKIQHINSSLLINLEIYDEFDDTWDSFAQQEAQKRLQQVRDKPDDYAAMVRCVPILADWACGQTGNPILDWQSPQWAEDAEFLRRGYHFTWDDINLVRMLWQRAASVLDMFDTFMEWFHQDDDAHLAALYRFLSEGDSHAFET